MKTVDITLGGRVFTVRGPTAGLLFDLEEARLDAIEATIKADRVWRARHGAPPEDEDDQQRALRVVSLKEGRRATFDWHVAVIAAAVCRDYPDMTPADVAGIEGATPDEFAIAATAVMLHVGLIKPGEVEAQPSAAGTTLG